MPRILLHTCCGPCTIYPLSWLCQQSWEVRGFFYNPNIHPYQEQQKRLQTLRSLAEQRELPLIVRPEYDMEHFLREVVFREEQRCIVCYSMRLEATAKLARKGGFDAFTSTLLYSRQQNHDLVRSLAEAYARKHGIPFLYHDFREGWAEGQEAAKLMNLYRQQYCGCIYSERDRYYRPEKPRRARNKPTEGSNPAKDHPA